MSRRVFARSLPVMALGESVNFPYGKINVWKKKAMFLRLLETRAQMFKNKENSVVVHLGS